MRCTRVLAAVGDTAVADCSCMASATGDHEVRVAPVPDVGSGYKALGCVAVADISVGQVVELEELRRVLVLEVAGEALVVEEVLLLACVFWLPVPSVSREWRSTR